jgi:hypothetical protein
MVQMICLHQLRKKTGDVFLDIYRHMHCCCTLLQQQCIMCRNEHMTPLLKKHSLNTGNQPPLPLASLSMDQES